MLLDLHFLGQTSDGHALHVYGTIMFDTIIWYVYYYIYKKYHRYERKKQIPYIVKAGLGTSSWHFG